MSDKDIKAVIIVFEDEVYVTKQKHIRDAVVLLNMSLRLNNPEDSWRVIQGSRPWKIVDKVLDENKTIKNR